MNRNRRQLESFNQVVGPIDRMIRTAIAFMVLIVSFTLPFSIFEFASLCGVTLYFFFTALTCWDPFYAVVQLLWQSYKDKAAINGRF